MQEEDPLEFMGPINEDVDPTARVYEFRRWSQDYTYRVGLGESPGLPNLEYLGLGYDLIRGNPRGSELNGLDPGFRYPVIRLVQKQSDLTVDQEYMVPLGTVVKVRNRSVSQAGAGGGGTGSPVLGRFTGH